MTDEQVLAWPREKIEARHRRLMIETAELLDVRPADVPVFIVKMNRRIDCVVRFMECGLTLEEAKAEVVKLLGLKSLTDD